MMFFHERHQESIVLVFCSRFWRLVVLMRPIYPTVKTIPMDDDLKKLDRLGVSLTGYYDMLDCSLNETRRLSNCQPIFWASPRAGLFCSCRSLILARFRLSASAVALIGGGSFRE